jgi:hypothetical protein
MSSDNLGNRDLTAAFESRFMSVAANGSKKGKMFATVEIMTREIECFGLETNSLWSIRSSHRDAVGLVDRMYQCKFKGFVLRVSRGIRCKPTSTTSCPAYFRYYRVSRGLPVGQFAYAMNKNFMQMHNHDNVEAEYKLDPKQRRLTNTEESLISDLVDNYAKPSVIAEHVEKLFGKVYTTSDISNMRWRRSSKRNNPGKLLFV